MIGILLRYRFGIVSIASRSHYTAALVACRAKPSWPAATSTPLTLTPPATLPAILRTKLSARVDEGDVPSVLTDERRMVNGQNYRKHEEELFMFTDRRSWEAFKKRALLLRRQRVRINNPGLQQLTLASRLSITL